MNIIVTLPTHLLTKIISGEKMYEMRKCLPKQMRIGEDGFFVVEKGTDDVRCWCRVDEVLYTYNDHNEAKKFASQLCVSEDYIEQYANGKIVYLWKIGKVIEFNSLKRESLYVDRNPQQFAYCPFSYGQTY